MLLDPPEQVRSRAIMGRSNYRGKMGHILLWMQVRHFSTRKSGSISRNGGECSYAVHREHWTVRRISEHNWKKK